MLGGIRLVLNVLSVSELKSDSFHTLITMETSDAVLVPLHLPQHLTRIPCPLATHKT